MMPFTSSAVHANRLRAILLAPIGTTPLAGVDFFKEVVHECCGTINWQRSYLVSVYIQRGSQENSSRDEQLQHVVKST